MLLKGKDESKILCGYIISPKQIDILNIKNYLCSKLPNYMITPHIILLDKFPLNSNGKIDKSALPVSKIESTVDYTSPRNENEIIFVKIFQEILGVERVGIDDSIFDLGGDSIKAIRMISKLREFGFEISVHQILENKTVQKYVLIFIKYVLSINHQLLEKFY